MSLGRVLAILGAAVAMLWFAVSAGLYVIAAQNARAEGIAAARLIAESTAKNLEHLLAQAGAALEQLAQESEFAEALAGGNMLRIVGVEERLTRLVPGALLVRLVPDTIELPDENRVPKMGFADLEMVRQTRTGKALPAFHAANTPDAHVALAQRLSQGDGVLLASLAPKLILSSLPAGLSQGAIELKQQALSLGFSGDAALKQAAPDGRVPIPGTAWAVAYWAPASIDPGLSWFFGLPAMAVAMAGVGGFFAYRWLNTALRHDQDNALSMVESLQSGQMARIRPVKLKDMERLTLRLAALEPMVHVVSEPSATSRQASPKLRTSIAVLASDQPPNGIQAPAGSVPDSNVAPAIQISPTLFRSFDIRGMVGEALTPEIARAIGRAIGSEARDRGEYTVAVGRDGRLSSPELSEALVRGLVASGCSVIDLGMVPTPLLYFATHVLNTESGVAVTGSHNPPNINGFKVVIAGETLAEPDLRKLRGRIEENDFHKGQGQLEFRSLVPDYVERIAHDIQLGRDMKVVLDCGNGAASSVGPLLLSELGCEVLPLFCEADGNFPNHPPDPSNPRNLQALTAAVLEHGADLGIALDGDGDRLGVVDSSGKLIWPDRLMMIYAADVLSREPGADIVFDVQCTRHLVSHIVRHGGRPLMWKTGHALLKIKIKETGALLAGDMSGHIFFKERWYGFDDGLYAAARLLEILSNDPRPSAEVFAELPDSANTPELSIPLREGEAGKIVDKFREIAHFPDARITDIDGLRIDFADGWGLVRASDTAQELLLRFEGDSEEALHRIMGEFRALLSKARPGIAFPSTLTLL